MVRRIHRILSPPPARASQFIEEDNSSSESSSSEYSDLLSVAAEETAATRGISDSLTKQLAIDIAARGGLDNFSLQNVCKEKPDLYGT
jgi:hypothetical protein